MKKDKRREYNPIPEEKPEKINGRTDRSGRWTCPRCGKNKVYFLKEHGNICKNCLELMIFVKDGQ